jgi:hypothetical protein
MAYAVVIAIFEHIRLRYLIAFLIIPLYARYPAKGKVSIEFGDGGFYLKWLKQTTLHFQADKEDRFISYNDIEDLRHGRSAITGSFIWLKLADGTKFHFCEQLRPFVKAEDFNELAGELELKYNGYKFGNNSGYQSSHSPKKTQEISSGNITSDKSDAPVKNSKGTKIASRLLILYICVLTVVTGTIMTAVVQPRKWTTAGELILKVVAVLLLIAISMFGTKLMLSRLAKLAAKIDEKELKDQSGDRS